MSVVGGVAEAGSTIALTVGITAGAKALMSKGNVVDNFQDYGERGSFTVLHSKLAPQVLGDWVSYVGMAFVVYV